MNNKPVVYFEKSSAYDVKLGQRGYVKAINHPKFGHNNVHTSTIMEIYADGSFETRNTVYKPELEVLSATQARHLSNTHIDQEKQVVMAHILRTAKNGHYFASFTRMSDPMQKFLREQGYYVENRGTNIRVEW